MKILWIGPVLKDTYISRHRAVSPAANQWQKSLIEALESLGNEICLLSHRPEPIWPRGGLIVRSKDDEPLSCAQAVQIGYINFPILRRLQRLIRFILVARLISKSPRAIDAIITYNSSFDADIAGFVLSRLLRLKWIAINADESPAFLADGHVYLSWNSFVENKSRRRFCMHLDGGVEIHPKNIFYRNCTSKQPSELTVFLYAGNFGPYGGAVNLVKAFTALKGGNYRLWLCGKGNNQEIDDICGKDKRISVFGLLPRPELIHKMVNADILVNPRPLEMADNERNFPSKLLEYLAMNKLIVSTWTKGLSPEYEKLAILVKSIGPQGMRQGLEKAIQIFNSSRHAEYMHNIYLFNQGHSWNVQALRLTNFLDQISQEI